MLEYLVYINSFETRSLVAARSPLFNIRHKIVVHLPRFGNDSVTAVLHLTYDIMKNEALFCVVSNHAILHLVFS